MANRYRNFCFTINNYAQDEIDLILTLKYKYLIIGDEVGKEGTEHLQGFISLEEGKTFSALKKYMPRAHIEIMKGSLYQNYEYCSKQKILIEEGERPKKQGNRSDLNTIKHYIDENPEASMEGVMEFVTNAQQIKLAEQIFKYREKPRTTKPKVSWFYGDTGTGKTREAVENCTSRFYIKDNANKWWEGYDAHETIIIDDIRRDTMPFNQLLRILDRYANRLECKGGSRQNRAEHIIITCPLHPEELYRGHVIENIDQLIRRIDKIKMFT